MMDRDVVQLLNETKQEHILDYLTFFSEEERQRLVEDIRQIDFEHIAEVYRTYSTPEEQSAEQKVFEAADVLRFDETGNSPAQRKRLYRLGEDALRDGRVGVFLVAGGQGTRLGFSGPKGCYPVSPIKQKTLFQLFAENIRGLERRYGRTLQWYIMTSSENNDQTQTYFRQQDRFGLKEDQVHFIVQKQIPSLDATGRLIVSRDKTIFKNPNGHGGSVYALADSGALARMRERGIEEIFYFQVDNPLAKIADPLFVGAHIEQRSEMSTKVVRKTDPDEKVGIIGKVNGRLGCIEYSELSADEAAEQTPDGQLRFNSANIAIHMLNCGFVEKLNRDRDFHLPYHIARKKIECLACGDGELKADAIDGIKFEMFIFDALGFARNAVTLEVPREEEFSPVKNRDGSDSPDTARAAMVQLHRSWLKRADNRAVPDDGIVEVSPLYALDGDAFAEKHSPDKDVSFPLYLE